jgi:hypothetical protein
MLRLPTALLCLCLLCFGCNPKCYYGKIEPLTWPTAQDGGASRPITDLRVFVYGRDLPAPIDRDSMFTLCNLKGGRHPERIAVGLDTTWIPTACTFSEAGTKEEPWLVKVTAAPGATNKDLQLPNIPWKGWNPKLGN